jgi:F-type H+-transporting ATPase subunit b
MELLHQLGIEPRILLLQAVGFIVLYLLLRAYLFGPIQTILGQREADVAATLDRSAEELQRAEALRAEYEQHLAQIREEGRQRMQQAVREAQEAREAMLAEARQQGDELLARARSEIDLETRKAMLQLREQVVELAIEAARKGVRESLDEAQHRAIMERAIAEFEAAAPAPGSAGAA